jgi:hypothetical protein
MNSIIQFSFWDQFWTNQLQLHKYKTYFIFDFYYNNHAT